MNPPPLTIADKARAAGYLALLLLGLAELCRQIREFLETGVLT